MLGGVLRKRWFDADGEPTLAQRGFAEHRLLRNHPDIVVEEAWYDIEGGPVTNPDGCARIRNQLDGDSVVETICDRIDTL